MALAQAVYRLKVRVFSEQVGDFDVQVRNFTR